MTTLAHLTGSHLRTYQTIMQQPEAPSLDWRSVRALLAAIGQVTEAPNGNLEVARNGHTLVLHPARTKNVSEANEILALRRFLEQSETAPRADIGRDPHLLVVIDHHEARLFRSEVNGGILERILPHAPDDYFRHAPHSMDFSRGQEKPDPGSFFEPVAKALQIAGQIVIFGTGTGMSSEMDQFVAWVKLHHPELAARIVGTMVVDEHHLTEGQLLAKAREFYANLPKSPASGR